MAKAVEATGRGSTFANLIVQVLGVRQPVRVARVDPDDDDVARFVVWHYRYDPERRERRNVTVAAFDNSAEYKVACSQLDMTLRARQASGEAELCERIGGHIKPVGSDRASRARRAEWQAWGRRAK